MPIAMLLTRLLLFDLMILMSLEPELKPWTI